MSLVRLTAEQGELRERAKAFVDQVLIPREEAAERAGGRLPAEDVEAIMKAAVAARLNGGRHDPAHGGQGWSATDYVVVHEQFGRNTNGLWWWVPDAYNVLAAGTPEQIEKYLRPALRGEAWISYAVTEEHAGSDPSGITTTAVPDGDGWRLDGEKWFVTSGDVAAAHIVVAQVEGHGPTLFIVDADAEGLEFADSPLFTHTFPHGHPTLRLTGVRVGPEAVFGGLGAADALQQNWFVEERLGIAVHCVAAMGRLLEEAVAWATTREQGGARLIDHQGVAFPLADSAADAAAARLMVYEVAALSDAGADRKVVHAKASLAKLFASEAAYRCADRAVQTFGGRGYMRTNVAERFLRELRVDRIWEGTSEIQRLIIARSLERRGVRPVIA
ncbi:acyl-CoA dehydrogenase family protein [Acrocarpospora catenulata]|uniref:acyl-CoA dehydrogenase family protein n=1 Tax=Acrocarpospora catenulata TaxID=2836182 RepID=UPI001BDB68AE|nr:acyl-CoA dehydrogenase family protein [Acrocarpospora catenulata]